MVALVLVTALWPCSSWAGEPQVFLEESNGPHLERVSGLELVEFNNARLRKMAREFAEYVAGQHKTGTLWIVTSRDDSERVQGVRVTGQLYSGWRRAWMQEYRTVFPVGRVSVISGDARLETRMPDGRIEREVISGRDPFVFDVERKSYEIVYLLVTEIRGIRGEGPIAGYQYRIMLCSPDGSSTPLSAAIMAELSRRLGASQIHASLRTNTWFRNANIPTVYPFRQPVIPPRTLREADPYESWCEFAEEIKCQSSR